MKKSLLILALLSVAALGMFSSFALAGNGHGHTPVTICHKPGTPAEQTLVVDDDSVQLTGHLGHGDTLGPCGGTTTTTETTTEETTTQETTTEETVTTPIPPQPPCGGKGYPDGYPSGKDGEQTGDTNDDCQPHPQPPLPPLVIGIPPRQPIGGPPSTTTTPTLPTRASAPPSHATTQPLTRHAKHNANSTKPTKSGSTPSATSDSPRLSQAASTGQTLPNTGYNSLIGFLLGSLLCITGLAMREGRLRDGLHKVWDKART